MLDKSSAIRELEDDVQDMQKMIEGYLAFARGEGTETPIATDLENLIDEVVAAEKRDGSKINLTLNIQNLQKLEVRPQAIKRALTNLISNSINYGKEKGTTEIGIEHKNGKVLLTINDNGEGISKDNMSRLFERFFRVDISRSRSHGGSGLGLAIVKHIIDAHNENINVQSTLQIGSEFSFTLKKSEITLN